MIYEKLFLDKNREVFVNEETTATLEPHHKEGLRSLYLQFTKKKPGYILNDQPNAGKRKQLAIFLNSIKHLLLEPTFIVCNDLEKWKHTLSYRMDDATDIAFNPDKLSADKKMFIGTLDKVLTLGRREWSVVVVEDNDCPGKLFKQLKGLTAGFKIVLTSVDLKKNYKTFSTIYEWIDPKEKVTLEMVFRQIEKTKSALDQTVLLDYYLQDKVLHRSDVGGISEDVYEDRPIARNKPPPAAKPMPKKNKDATGTKVKRSKPKPAEERTSDTPSDSSRFEFDTMSAYEYEEVNINNPKGKTCHDKDLRTDVNDKRVFETDHAKGSKRKCAMIIESDDESERVDTAILTNVNGNDLGTKIDVNNHNNMTNQDDSFEVNSVCLKKVVSPECENVIMQDHLTEQHDRNNPKTEDECCKESASSQKHNQLMEISPDLFSNNELGKVTIESKTVSDIAGCPTKDKKELASGFTNMIKDSKGIIARDEFNNEIKMNEPNKCDEINRSKIMLVEETCSQVTSSIFDEKMRDLQEKTFNKFKGSVLDCLF